MKQEIKVGIAAVLVVIFILLMLSALVYGFSTDQLAVFLKKLVAVPVR